MKILQRYILKELWLPFLLSLVVLNFIFMGGYLVRAANFIVGRGVPIQDTFYILLLALPGMIGYTIPTSVLMAVLVVFGSLSQNNELRAMKASGVNLLHVVVPTLIAGMILSAAMFVFNDQIASNANFELRRSMKKMIIKFPKALIEPGRFVKLSDEIIFMTKKAEGDELRDIVAYEVSNSEEPVRTIIAEKGKIFSQPDSGAVQIVLYNGSISDSKSEGVNTMLFKSYEFPSFGQEDIRKMQKKKRDYTLAEMLVAVSGVKLDPSDSRELWAAFHERISFAFGCFIFVLLGIPIAVLVHRGEIVLSFGIAMTCVSLYYVLFAGAKTFAVQGLLPAFFSMWMPNMLLFGAGIYLMRRALAS